MKNETFLYFAISAGDLHGNFLVGRDPKTIPVANELCGRDLVGEIFFLLLSYATGFFSWIANRRRSWPKLNDRVENFDRDRELQVDGPQHYFLYIKGHIIANKLILQRSRSKISLSSLSPIHPI